MRLENVRVNIVTSGVTKNVVCIMTKGAALGPSGVHSLVGVERRQNTLSKTRYTTGHPHRQIQTCGDSKVMHAAGHVKTSND